MRKLFRRLVIAAALGLLLLTAGGWLAFVPWPREPGYRFVSVWGEKGSGPAQFLDPTGIVVTDGAVFVADYGNNRIQKWRPKGGE